MGKIPKSIFSTHKRKFLNFAVATADFDRDFRIWRYQNPAAKSENHHIFIHGCSNSIWVFFPCCKYIFINGIFRIFRNFIFLHVKKLSQNCPWVCTFLPIRTDWTLSNLSISSIFDQLQSIVTPLPDGVGWHSSILGLCTLRDTSIPGL